ncbi:MAG: PEP-CTERM sorting domain-containing protein [Planctomycetota bacterium]
MTRTATAKWFASMVACVCCWAGAAACGSSISVIEFATPATDDGVVVDSDGNAAFETFIDPQRPDRLEIAKLPGAGGESRVLLAFDVSGLQDEPIGVATLEVFIDLLIHSSSAVNIYGFAGDGSLDLDDADRQGEMLGSYVAVDLGIGEQSIVLNAYAMQRLLEPSTSSIELRLEASSAIADTSIDKVQPLFASSPPMLRLISIPEPSTTALLLGMLTLTAASRRQHAR